VQQWINGNLLLTFTFLLALIWGKIAYESINKYYRSEKLIRFLSKRIRHKYQEIANGMRLERKVKEFYFNQDKELFESCLIKEKEVDHGIDTGTDRRV
jgi:hypothetical protein